MKHRVCIMENDFYHPLSFVDFYVVLNHQTPNSGKAAVIALEYFTRCKSARSFEFT